MTWEKVNTPIIPAQMLFTKNKFVCKYDSNFYYSYDGQNWIMTSSPVDISPTRYSGNEYGVTYVETGVTDPDCIFTFNGINYINIGLDPYTGSSLILNNILYRSDHYNQEVQYSLL